MTVPCSVEVGHLMSQSRGQRSVIWAGVRSVSYRGDWLHFEWKIFTILLSSFWQIPEWYLKLCHESFLPTLFLVCSFFYQLTLYMILKEI
jgi:hypothetical protein